MRLPESKGKTSMELELGSTEGTRWERMRRGALAAVALRWELLLTALIVVSPAFFLFPLIQGQGEYLIDNTKLTERERLAALGAVALSLLVMGGGLLWWWRRRSRETGDAAGALRRINRRLLWLLALPWVPLLLVPKIETSKPWAVFAAAAILAGIAIAAVYAWRLPEKGRLPRLAVILAFALPIAYGVYFSMLAITHHQGLGTRVYDLSIYDNVFWHSAHGNLLGSSIIRSGTHIAAHFNPLLILLSPFYLLYPHAEFLLVLQSFWLAAGAIPLFFLARRALGGPWLALAMVAVYLMYPAMHGANLYDFHSLTLAGPLLIAAMAALEAGRIRTYALLLALLFLTREDLPLVVMGIGLYILTTGKGWRLALATIGSAAAYLAVVKLFIMPDPGLLMANTSESHGYAYYYKDLIPFSREGASGLILSLIVNPIFVIQHLATEPKLRFFAQLFLPLLFLPFFLRRGKLVMAYGFAFLFLSSRTAVHSIHFQYSTVLAPFALVLAALALGELRERAWVRRLGVDGARLVPALLVGMLVATAAISFKFGAIFPSDSFRGGFSKLQRKLSKEQKADYRWIREVKGQFPNDASVAATARVGPHVSNREKAFYFPARIDEAEYLLIHRDDLRGGARKTMSRIEEEKSFELVSSRGRMQFWKRSERPGEGAAEDAGGEGGAADYEDDEEGPDDADGGSEGAVGGAEIEARPRMRLQGRRVLPGGQTPVLMPTRPIQVRPLAAEPPLQVRPLPVEPELAAEPPQTP